MTTTTAHRFVAFVTAFLSALLSGALLVAPAVGQQSADRAPQTRSGESSALIMPESQGSITLDGHVGEDEWQGARRLPLVRRKSDFGSKPEQKTDILVTHDEEYIYVACRCYASEPPTATSFERDGGFWGSDRLQLLIDTFNDEENGLFFAVTPTGNRIDAAISNDFVFTGGGSAIDVDWNTYWNVEVRQTEEGWFAEMRIPASSLRFEADGEQVVMGLTAWRWLVKKNEDYVFPPISMDQGAPATMKPSNARDVVFNGLESDPPFRVTPYLLGGAERRSRLNEAETAYDRPTDLTYDAGLDVKYGLTTNLTLDLTFNTDFAQVEADNQQVNLTRFPLFFPEKRRFFLERSSNFAFDFGGPNRLFYSRRIGLSRGQPVRILGGARLVGRAGRWDIGALSMQTGREPDLGPEDGALPSENFSVLRLQREVINDYSQVGGIVTSRVGLEGDRNLAYGLDATIRPAEDEYLTAKWAQTFTGAGAEQLLSFRPARMQLLWERRTYEGLSYDLRYDRAGPRYKPEMGFELREDFFRLGDEVGYGWIPGDESPIERHRLSLQGDAFFRNADQSLQTLEVGPEWSLTTSSQHSLTVEALYRVEDLRRPFSLSGAVPVPTGRYTFFSGEIDYEMPSDWDVNTGLGVTGGQFYDGWRGTAQAWPTWNVSRRLQIGGFYQINRIRFPERGEAFTAHVGRLRVDLTPSVEHSVSGFLQYNSAREVVVSNLRYRYNPSQGHDLYLVYNERLNTDRSTGLDRPRLPRSAQRAVVLKYNYTFNW
jgi:hypothetical protein